MRHPRYPVAMAALALAVIAGNAGAATYAGQIVSLNLRPGVTQIELLPAKKSEPACQKAARAGQLRTPDSMTAAQRQALTEAFIAGATVVVTGTGTCIDGVETFSSFALRYPDPT